MLKDILEAEKRAREYTEEAEKYKAETMAAIEASKKKIIEDRLKEAEAEVQRIRSGHEQSIEDSLKSVEISSKEAVEKLTALEKEKFNDWTEVLFSRVLRDE